MASASLVLTATLIASVCAGCAYSYHDAEGNRHIVGLVDLTLRRDADPRTFAGDVADLKTFGFSIGRSPQGGYLTAGYSREVTAILRDDVLVVGNPITAIQQEKRGERE